MILLATSYTVLAVVALTLLMFAPETRLAVGYLVLVTSLVWASAAWSCALWWKRHS